MDAHMNIRDISTLCNPSYPIKIPAKGEQLRKQGVQEKKVPVKAESKIKKSAQVNKSIAPVTNGRKKVKIT